MDTGLSAIFGAAAVGVTVGLVEVIKHMSKARNNARASAEMETPSSPMSVAGCMAEQSIGKIAEQIARTTEIQRDILVLTREIREEQKITKAVQERVERGAVA